MIGKIKFESKCESIDFLIELMDYGFKLIIQIRLIHLTHVIEVVN